MKECKYCRSMYEDSLSSCPNCGGNKIVTAEEKAEENTLHQKEIENKERAIAAPEMQKRKLLGIVAGVVAVIVSIIAIASYNANKPMSNGMTKDEGEAVLVEGISYYESGDYEAAIECFVQLPIDSEQYEEAQKMLAKSEDSYVSSIIEKANDYTSKSQHEVALELLENAQTLLPENANLQKVYNDTNAAYKLFVRRNAIKEADEYVNSNDFESAINTINTALDRIGQDEELLAKFNTYEDSYVTSVISAAKKQYVEYNATSIYAAEEMIEKAMLVIPENEKLQSELNYYKDREPVALLDLEVSPSLRSTVSTYPFESVESITDVSGVTYKNVIAPVDWYETSHPYGWSETGSCARYSWLLDYQYSKITGVFLFDEKYSNAPIETKLTIAPSSGAEKTFTTTNTSGAKNFEVDLTGSKDVEIIIDQDEINGTYAYLADVYLWK